MEKNITFQNITVAPYIVEQLLDVKIDQQINEHGTLYFRALLPEEKKDSYAKNSSEGSSVSLMAKGADGNSDILFQGMVQDVEVTAIQGSYYMEVHAVSHSYLLDVGKKSRSFQDKQMKYNKLAEQVVSDYGDAVIKDVSTQDAATGQLIVQYEETDWEFLKRLASHFNTGLVGDIHADYPKCYFGVPENGKRTLETSHYTVRQNAGRYLKLLKSGISGLQEQDFIYYEAETYLPTDLGDKVKFQGQTLYVSRIKGRMEKGIFLYHLTLATKKGMSQMRQLHEKISGGSLNASITEIKNDQVKVSLEIDELSGHNPGTPCFFPYSTIYSSKDGSGWYCMPETGDRVRIYFPDGIEEHGYAISSVHEEVDNGFSSDTVSSPGSSSFSSINGSFGGSVSSSFSSINGSSAGSVSSSFSSINGGSADSGSGSFNNINGGSVGSESESFNSINGGSVSSGSGSFNSINGSSAGNGSGSSGGSGYSGQRDDPSVKSIRNKDGKEIRLTPDGIYIISDGTVITLTDDGGVSITSDKDIEFKSDKNIILSAEENVNIVGLTGVDLSCNETASVKIEENVEVTGQEVKAN